jgi:RNA-directed DNA polymerase
LITREFGKPLREEKQMTAVQTQAGASFHNDVDWNQIDWGKVKGNVRRLQMRIVKAIEEGRWGKVKALQRLLTHSFSAKALAVRRVTENQGKRTPGVDGETWNTPKKKAQGVMSLRQHGYRAQPLRRTYIRKSNGKQRPLGIATMKDRAMQTLYKLALDPIAETTGDPNSYGFREKRSAADAIAQCFLCLSRKRSATAILEADIRGCFDNISFEWLMANIPMDKGILKQWLKAGYIDRNVFYKTKKGTPQGSPISPVLANLALDGLEAAVIGQYPRRLRRQRQIHLVRYADDFVVFGRNRDLLETDIKPTIEAFLAKRGLTLSAEKTKITDIETGFDFLGQNVRKYNGTLLIKPTRKSVQTLLHKIRTTIKTHQHLSAGQLITKLNPIIRGWANYHRYVVSKEIFAYIDHRIYEILWRWAKRRHRNKGKRWVYAKYFRPNYTHQTGFYGQVKGKDGSSRTQRLTKAAKIPIKRHVKVKAEANPFDPKWERYFEKRLDAKMATEWRGRRSLLTLWQSQNGLCPICQHKITKETGWENHHRSYRVNGGPDTSANRVLLHPTCHKQVHSLGLSVLEPRPTTGRS